VRHGKGHVAAGEVSGEVGDNRDYLGLPGNSKSSFSGPGTLAYDATGAETKGASSERVSSLKVGPQVRIRLPPAASPVRTALLRYFEENAELGFLIIRPPPAASPQTLGPSVISASSATRSPGSPRRLATHLPFILSGSQQRIVGFDIACHL
jgi:hypothetical protein